MSTCLEWWQTLNLNIKSYISHFKCAVRVSSFVGKFHASSEVMWCRGCWDQEQLEQEHQCRSHDALNLTLSQSSSQPSAASLNRLWGAAADGSVMFESTQNNNRPTAKLVSIKKNRWDYKYLTLCNSTWQ